jgi:hypothetical protein
VVTKSCLTTTLTPATFLPSVYGSFPSLRHAFSSQKVFGLARLYPFASQLWFPWQVLVSHLSKHRLFSFPSLLAPLFAARVGGCLSVLSGFCWRGLQIQATASMPCPLCFLLADLPIHIHTLPRPNLGHSFKAQPSKFLPLRLAAIVKLRAPQSALRNQTRAPFTFNSKCM